VDPRKLLPSCIARGERHEAIPRGELLKHDVDCPQPLGGLRMPGPIGMEEKKWIPDQGNSIHLVHYSYCLLMI